MNRLIQVDETPLSNFHLIDLWKIAQNFELFETFFIELLGKAFFFSVEWSKDILFIYVCWLVMAFQKNFFLCFRK